MATYQASNPGVAKQITSPESGTVYRGWQAMTEVTMAFTSGANVFASQTYPQGFLCPAQIDSIESISGTIAAFEVLPNAGSIA